MGAGGSGTGSSGASSGNNPGSGGMSTPGGASNNKSGAGAGANVGKGGAAVGASKSSGAPAGTGAKGAAAGAAAKAGATAASAAGKAATGKASPGAGAGAAASAAKSAAAKAGAVGASTGGNKAGGTAGKASPGAGAGAAAAASKANAGLAGAARAQGAAQMGKASPGAGAGAAAAAAKSAATAATNKAGGLASKPGGTTTGANLAGAAKSAVGAGLLGTGTNKSGPNAAAAAAANRAGPPAGLGGIGRFGSLGTVGASLASQAQGAAKQAAVTGFQSGQTSLLGVGNMKRGPNAAAAAAAQAAAMKGITTPAGLNTLMSSKSVTPDTAVRAAIQAYKGKPSLGYDPAAGWESRYAPKGARMAVGLGETITHPVTGQPISGTTRPGIHSQVDKSVAEHFQNFVNDLAKEGAFINPQSTFGYGLRRNQSAHPSGFALDVNQVDRRTRANPTQNLSAAREADIASFHGLFSGVNFPERGWSKDAGHFEATNAESLARAQRGYEAAKALGVTPSINPQAIGVGSPTPTTRATPSTAPATTPTAVARSLARPNAAFSRDVGWMDAGIRGYPAHLSDARAIAGLGLTPAQQARASMVAAMAREQGVDPHQAVSIAMQETGKFKAMNDKKGDIVGTMQVSTPAFKDVHKAEMARNPNVTPTDRKDKAVNVSTGLAYAKQMEQRAKDMGLAPSLKNVYGAYNVGPGFLKSQKQPNKPMSNFVKSNFIANQPSLIARGQKAKSITGAQFANNIDARLREMSQTTGPVAGAPTSVPSGPAVSTTAPSDRPISMESMMRELGPAIRLAHQSAPRANVSKPMSPATVAQAARQAGVSKPSATGPLGSSTSQAMAAAARQAATAAQRSPAVGTSTQTTMGQGGLGTPPGPLAGTSTSNPPPGIGTPSTATPYGSTNTPMAAGPATGIANPQRTGETLGGLLSGVFNDKGRVNQGVAPAVGATGLTSGATAQAMPAAAQQQAAQQAVAPPAATPMAQQIQSIQNLTQRARERNFANVPPAAPPATPVAQQLMAMQNLVQRARERNFVAPPSAPPPGAFNDRMRVNPGVAAPPAPSPAIGMPDAAMMAHPAGPMAAYMGMIARGAPPSQTMGQTVTDAMMARPSAPPAVPGEIGRLMRPGQISTPLPSAPPPSDVGPRFRPGQISTPLPSAPPAAPPPAQTSQARMVTADQLTRIAEQVAKFGTTYSDPKLSFARMMGMIPADVSITRAKNGGWAVTKDGITVTTTPNKPGFNLTSNTGRIGTSFSGDMLGSLANMNLTGAGVASPGNQQAMGPLGGVSTRPGQFGSLAPPSPAFSDTVLGYNTPPVRNFAQPPRSLPSAPPAPPAPPMAPPPGAFNDRMRINPGTDSYRPGMINPDTATPMGPMGPQFPDAPTPSIPMPSKPRLGAGPLPNLAPPTPPQSSFAPNLMNPPASTFAQPPRAAEAPMPPGQHPYSDPGPPVGPSTPTSPSAPSVNPGTPGMNVPASPPEARAALASLGINTNGMTDQAVMFFINYVLHGPDEEATPITPVPPTTPAAPVTDPNAMGLLNFSGGIRG